MQPLESETTHGFGVDGVEGEEGGGDGREAGGGGEDAAAEGGDERGGRGVQKDVGRVEAPAPPAAQLVGEGAVDSSPRRAPFAIVDSREVVADGSYESRREARDGQ